MTKNTVSLSLEDARQLMELYNTCELADRHFHSCQGDLFRRHVSAACHSPNVSGAFERLKAKIAPESAQPKGA